jgi:hypothetical protein
LTDLHADIPGPGPLTVGAESVDANLVVSGQAVEAEAMTSRALDRGRNVSSGGSTSVTITKRPELFCAEHVSLGHGLGCPSDAETVIDCGNDDTFWG